MKTKSLKAEKRELVGRRVKRLRKDGVIPGNIFGKGLKSISIQLPLKDFTSTYEEVGETGIIELTVGNSKNPVLVSNVQVDPVTDEFIHVDFHQIDLKEKVTATVPLVLVGESPAVKEGLGMLVQQLHELEVEALPADLPDALEVNIGLLKAIDDHVDVVDIKYDKSKIELSAQEDQVVAQIAAEREEEPEPLPAAPEAEEGAPTEEAPPQESTS
jgi:large subunit ribosomal protein L25